MTEPERVAPKGAARGRAAASELVEVYKVLHHAGRPLTVPEIADKMPKGFLSAAMNAYREHKEQTDPTWLEGKGSRWSKPAEREAMAWWVRRIVGHGRNIKILNIATKSVQNMYGIVQEGTYAPGRAPMVRRKVWVEKSSLVEWSPEDDAALNQGHGAGMEFTRRYDEIAANPKSTKADWRAVAEIGNRAIRPKLR